MNVFSLQHPQHSLNAHGGAVQARRDQLDAAAEDFEAMFLQQILKQMRKAGDVLSADNPMRSRDLDTMRDLHDEALAGHLARGRQTGIADMIVRQLGGEAAPESDHVPAPALQPAPMIARTRTPGDAVRPFVHSVQRGLEQAGQMLERGALGFQALVDSVVRHESGGRVDAVSHKGARGLMQLMPATAREMAAELGLVFSERRLTEDADYNMQLGQAYLQKMLDRYDGEPALALAAYNAGPGRVDGWLQRLGDPRGGAIGVGEWVERIPFSETRNYTRSILAEVGAAAAPDEQARLNQSARSVATVYTDEAKHAGEAHQLRSPAFAQPIRTEPREPAS